jgi:ferredoxin
MRWLKSLREEFSLHKKLTPANVPDKDNFYNPPLWRLFQGVNVSVDRNGGTQRRISTALALKRIQDSGGRILIFPEGGWTKLVAACLYPVEQDLVVRTRSEKVDKIRKMILEFLLAHAPNSSPLQDLAQEYGADKDRFEKESSFCILCGLCVRYCAEVKKKNAVGYVDCGARREIRFIVSPGSFRSHRISCVFYRFIPNRIKEITRLRARGSHAGAGQR